MKMAAKKGKWQKLKHSTVCPKHKKQVKHNSYQ